MSHYITSHLQAEEVLEPLGIDGGAQASDGVPARDTGEAVVTAGAVATVAEGTTESLVADSDIVEGSLGGLGESVESRVGEADGALADAETLLVDTVQNSGNNGG